METLICSKLISLETRLVDLSLIYGLKDLESKHLPSYLLNLTLWILPNRDFVLRPLFTKLFVTLSIEEFNSYEACLIWKYNPMIYFWVNWSTIDSLNHLFNVPSVFCQKSSFGRFLIFWFHSFGNWYPLAFLFNWALYYYVEFLYALVLKIIAFLKTIV